MQRLSKWCHDPIISTHLFAAYTFGSLESKLGITVLLKLGLEIIPSSGSLMSKVGTLWAGPQDWEGFNRNFTLWNTQNIHSRVMAKYQHISTVRQRVQSSYMCIVHVHYVEHHKFKSHNDSFHIDLLNVTSIIVISLGPLRIFVIAMVEMKMIGTRERIHPMPLDHIG